MDNTHNDQTSAVPWGFLILSHPKSRGVARGFHFLDLDGHCMGDAPALDGIPHEVRIGDKWLPG
jgi:hypothetical protein